MASVSLCSLFDFCFTRKNDSQNDCVQFSSLLKIVPNRCFEYQFFILSDVIPPNKTMHEENGTFGLFEPSNERKEREWWKWSCAQRVPDVNYIRVYRYIIEFVAWRFINIIRLSSGFLFFPPSDAYPLMSCLSAVV